MTYKLKHVFLALGLSAAFIGCGDPCFCENDAPLTYSANIQKDMKSLSCLSVGCHSRGSTTKLSVDTAAGMEVTNYNNILQNQLVIKGNPSASPLIQIPSTGIAAGGAPHVKTLFGIKLTDWTTWVTNQASF